MPRPRLLHDKQCQWCMASFRGRSYLRFCSQSCASQSRESHRVKRTKRCEQCSETFHAYRQQLRFCSNSCSNLARPTQDPAITRQRQQLASMACGLVARALRHTGRNKYARVEEELGYSTSKLKAHLESLWKGDMSWENYGKTGWHVDHVRPISSFPLDTPASEISSLNNLQPLWEKDNLQKARAW